MRLNLCVCVVKGYTEVKFVCVCVCCEGLH